MKECRYHSQLLHTHTSWHYEVTVKLATRNIEKKMSNEGCQSDIDLVWFVGV